MSKTRLDDRIGSPSSFQNQRPRPGLFLPHLEAGVTIVGGLGKEPPNDPKIQSKTLFTMSISQSKRSLNARLSRRPKDARNHGSCRIRNYPKEWWAWEDLNFRPHAYQARALTN